MNSTEYYTQCPECQSGLIEDYSKGEYICQKCGYVVMEQIEDYGPECHATHFDDKMKMIRASGSTSYSLHDYGLRTEIGFTSKDYSGRSIDHQMAEQMNNMRNGIQESESLLQKKEGYQMFYLKLMRLAL